MTTCPDCSETWGGKRLEHCTACHETFTATSSGDRHRTGSYFPDERRCLTPDEMRAKGMTQNARGHWTNGGTDARWTDDGRPRSLDHLDSYRSINDPEQQEEA